MRSSLVSGCWVGWIGGNCFFVVDLILRNFHDCLQRITIVDVHDPNALSVPTNDTDFGSRNALDFPEGGDHEQFVFVCDRDDSDHGTIPLAGLDIHQTATAASLRSVRLARIRSIFAVTVSGLSRFGISAGGCGVFAGCVVNVRPSIFFALPEPSPFAVALFTNSEQRCIGVGNDHTDNFVVFPQPNTFHARGVSSHRTCVRLGESNRLAAGGAHEYFVVRTNHDHVDQFVIITQLDGDNAASLWPRISVQWGFLHQSIFGGHHEEVTGQIEVANGNTLGNRFAFSQIEQVDDCSTAAFATELRNVVNLLPIHFSLAGEEQQIGVRAGDEQVFNWIFVFNLGTFNAFTAAFLSSVGAGWNPFDVPTVADRHNHGFFGDEIF